MGISSYCNHNFAGDKQESEEASKHQKGNGAMQQRHKETDDVVAFRSLVLRSSPRPVVGCYTNSCAVMNRLVIAFGCNGPDSIQSPTHWAMSASSIGVAHIDICTWTRALIHRVRMSMPDLLRDAVFNVNLRVRVATCPNVVWAGP